MISSLAFNHSRSHNFTRALFTLALLLPLVFTTTTKLLALELEQAQRIARLYSDQAQVITANQHLDNAVARQTTAFARPQVDTYANWTKIDSNATNPFLTTPTRDLTVGVQASQLLFAGGRIWYSSQLRDSLEQFSTLHQHTQILELDYAVAIAFITAQYQQQVYTIASERVQQLQQELDDATALFHLGSAPQLDVREAQLTLHQAQNTQQASASELYVAITNFNQQLGRSTSEKRLTPSTKLEQRQDIDLLLATLEQQIVERKQQDLLSSAIDYTISRQQQQLATGTYWPTIAVTASAETQGEEQDDMDEAWTVGLQLDWRVLSGGEISAKHAQAQAITARAGARQQQTYKKLLAAYANLHQQQQDLVEQIQRQRQAVKIAQENYADARALYLAGTITMTHLGQYNLAYAESRFNLSQLLYNHNRLYHELRRLTA
jgi:outer membrane protein TolC